MYICRLFHRDAPAEQIDARLLADGRISIGRDPSADWMLDDPEGTLSRIHCLLSVEQGGLVLRDCSTNGVLLDSGERVAHDVPVAIEPETVLTLGGLAIRVDRAPQQGGDADATCIAQMVPLTVPSLPRDWTDPVAALRPAPRDASLIEAFCAGAGIDASALSGEDPAEVMQRAGAMYRQTILGLAGLLADRMRLKQESGLDRTTIGAVDNNPFKWAPTRKLAETLLVRRTDGFLSDAQAVRASFEDLADHLAGVSAGASAATADALAAMDPAAIEGEAAGAGFSLRGKAAQCWDLAVRRHAKLADGGIARSFRQAYARASDTRRR